VACDYLKPASNPCLSGAPDPLHCYEMHIQYEYSNSTSTGGNSDGSLLEVPCPTGEGFVTISGCSTIAKAAASGKEDSSGDESGSPGVSGGDPSDLLNLPNLAEKVREAQAAEEPLPALKGSIAESFKDGQYSTRTFKAGTTFYRAEAWNATGPGSFLGTEPVDISNEAEQAYNLDMWNNPREVMRIYQLNQDLTMYYGEVAGGEGYQTLIPRGINPADVLTQIGARALP
jgi:hypothetical protein